MGPLPGINHGIAGSLSYTSSVGITAENVPQLTDNSGAIGAGSAGTSVSRSITSINTMVTDLLQSVGGGAENDKILRMMIVLLILLALLQNQEGNSGQTSDILQSLNGGNNNNGENIHIVSLYSSSTTISIQQSTTTMMVGGAFDTGGVETQGTEGQLDVVV
ncbi:MAG: hypothetical protein JSU63_07995 [Phycisphaerales bacterium]|nr:MAG: hypothetical protein JSU63_07995 [Phycisphaerales bacterium]